MAREGSRKLRPRVRHRHRGRVARYVEAYGRRLSAPPRVQRLVPARVRALRPPAVSGASDRGVSCQRSDADRDQRTAAEGTAERRRVHLSVQPERPSRRVGARGPDRLGTSMRLTNRRRAPSRGPYLASVVRVRAGAPLEQQMARDLTRDPVAVARNLQALIREHADETERGRKLAAPIVDALRSHGLFSMGVPAALGGLETPLTPVLQAIEEIAYADGATGWNVMIAFDSGLMAAHLSAARSRMLVASIPRAIIAGSIAPTGQIQRTDGGYRLTGRWPFGSGCQQTDIFILGAILFEKGAPVVGANGIPEMMEVAVPAAAVKILDTWRVAGLRGTGSHDFAIENLLVDEGFVQPMNFGAPVDKGVLYEFPMVASFAIAKAAVALGNARHAIDALKDLAWTKIPTGTMS